MYRCSNVSLSLCAGSTNNRGSEIYVVCEAGCPLPIQSVWFACVRESHLVPKRMFLLNQVLPGGKSKEQEEQQGWLWFVCIVKTVAA